MSAAALLPAPPRPPHDPLRMRLGCPRGWGVPVAASNMEVDRSSGALVLTPLTGTQRLPSEPSGSLGGLVLPKWMARDCEDGLWLLSRKQGKLHRFDPCTCAFVPMPCTTGIGPGARQLGRAGGIAVWEDTLFLCDAVAGGRLLLFDRRSFALRAELAPPPGATAQPWVPTAVAIDRGTVHVVDPANGGVHRFAAWGGWLGMTGGFGAVDAIAFDCGHRALVVASASDTVWVIAPGAAPELLDTTPCLLAGCLPGLDFQISREGLVELSAICPQGAGQGFDCDGHLAPWPPEPDPAFETSGTWIAGPIDSRISECVWDKLVLDGGIAPHQSIALAAYTAEVELPAADIAMLKPGSWTALPATRVGQESLFLGPPGRYLWLRIELHSDGAGTPCLNQATIDYPRISLRRYLPAAFGANPQASDFTDRLLAIFDSGFRSFERQIDDEARLFDPLSAPADPGNDVLGWIASWLGIALERGWPLARRRHLVKAAGKLIACRGTLAGMRGSLLLWLGWDREFSSSRRSACGPRCRPPMRRPIMPQLVLEHWKLRRWLWLGKGRLGSDAVLWGEKILGRSRLNETARADVTRLDSTRNPLTDPFNQSANRFSVFVPAHSIADSRTKAQLHRLIEDQRPADALAIVVPVHARMRIGIQACIGFDSVVGCWPQGVTLDQAELGRGTVLSGRTPGKPTQTIGQTSRIQPPPRPRPAREPECRL